MNFTTGAPYKSVAAALILVLMFGPLGVFYSSLIGGVVMSIFGLAAIGLVISQSSPLPMCTVWLFSILWAMISVRYYNRSLWKTVLQIVKHQSGIEMASDPQMKKATHTDNE